MGGQQGGRQTREEGKKQAESSWQAEQSTHPRPRACKLRLGGGSKPGFNLGHWARAEIMAPWHYVTLRFALITLTDTWMNMHTLNLFTEMHVHTIAHTHTEQIYTYKYALFWFKNRGGDLGLNLDPALKNGHRQKEDTRRLWHWRKRKCKRQGRA